MSLRVSLSYPGLCRTLLTSLRSYFQLLWYMLCTEEGSATWWCTSTQNSAVNIFCQAPVQSPDFSLGTRSWLCFPPVTTKTRRTRRRITRRGSKLQVWFTPFFAFHPHCHPMPSVVIDSYLQLRQTSCSSHNSSAPACSAHIICVSN